MKGYQDATLEELVAKNDDLVEELGSVPLDVVSFHMARIIEVQGEIIQRLGVRELTRQEREFRYRSRDECDALWQNAYDNIEADE